MKSKLVKFLSVIAVVAFLVSCAPTATVAPKAAETTAPAAPAATAAPAKKGPTLVGLAMPGLVGGQEWVIQFVQQEVEKRGWKLITTNSGGNPQKQNDDIDFLISMGVIAIVNNPDDSSAICTAINKAHAAKIPFGTLDRSPMGCAADIVVQSDNRMAGKQGGELMVAALKEKYGTEKGKVLEITGNIAQDVGQMRRDGFHDAVDKFPNITVIQKIGDWDATKGQQIVRDVLNANPDLDGIYMHSEVVYGAGTQAVLEELGRWKHRGEPGHIALTGVDGGPWMLKSVWDGYAEGTGNQPSRYFNIVVEMLEKIVKEGPLKEGQYVKEGVFWSPAVLKKNADGSMVMMLATLKSSIDNITDPVVWSYHYPDLVPPAGSPWKK